MKNLILTLILFVIFACTNNNQYQFIEQNGKVHSVEVYQKYDPIIHVNIDVYKVGIEFPDTLIYIISNNRLEIGDTIKIHRKLEQE